MSSDLVSDQHVQYAPNTTGITTEKASSMPGLRAGCDNPGTGAESYIPAVKGQPPSLELQAAEARLLRKIDWHVVPTVAILYLWCFIDRANIGNARIAGMEHDLHLTGNQYNALLTCFYLSYIVFEIPSNLACKYFGPARWIPFLAVGFGTLSMCTAFVTTFSNAAAVRFLLGVFEAGMMPGTAYYLSRWYRKTELTFRLALYILGAPLAGAFGGLLASGILWLDGIGWVTSWRQLFLVEGLITIGLGLVGFATMPDHPSTASWLTPAEKDLAIRRLQGDNVATATSASTDRWSAARLRRGIANPNTLATAFVFLFNCITAQGIAFFTPTIVATIYPSATVVRKQLWTVPPYVVGASISLVVPYASWKTGRSLPYFILVSCFAIVGYVMFLATSDAKVRYGAVFLAVSGAFSFGALTNAHVSANVLSDTARTTAIGWNVLFGNIGGLISTWSYLSWDGPDYHIGNGLNLAGNCVILLLSIGLLLYLSWDNKRRQGVDPHAVLEGLTPDEEQDLDWKHPAFRWTL